jgi:hypothetical protein
MAASNSDAKSGEESIPEFVAYGRVYIDRHNVGHVCLHVSEKHASLWFQNHVRIACWVWSAEVEFEPVARKENGQRLSLNLTTCCQQWWPLEAVQEEASWFSQHIMVDLIAYLRWQM